MINLKVNSMAVKNKDGQYEYFEAIKGKDGLPGPEGPKGDQGEKGDDGKTPVKGTDYFTQSDIAEFKADVVNNILKDEEVTTTTTWSSQKIADKINDIELAKFPNVTIIGQPTINQGQISNFSSDNYCQFPFVVDFQNQAFTIDFEITTGNEITQQHNVLDSQFGLAFAVRNSKFVIAISTNGTSWNIGEGVGTHTVLANTTYRVKMEWDKTNFTVSYSTDGGNTYIQDIVKALTAQPYPKQMFIGVTSDKTTVFNGIVNLNYAKLTIANKVVWQGMDDVGLATRMAVDMSNIDIAGENKVKEIIKTENYQPQLISGTNIKTVNGQTLLGNGNLVLDTGKVDDVKVNGQSVVTNKIAEISNTVVTMRKW